MECKTVLVPGRELDMIIAEKVIRDLSPWELELGKNLIAQGQEGFISSEAGSYGIIPAYSTNIAAAWEVVEKLNLLKRYHITKDSDSGEYIVGFDSYYLDGNYEILGRASSAPHAICLAALKAVGVNLDSN